LNKLLRRLLAAAAVATALSSLLVSPAAAEDGGGLAAVRKATNRFHDVEKAKNANYLPALACFDLPGVGGMGQHLINGDLMNGTVSPTRPQALVYEVDGDELHLVAVEYIIPYKFVPPTAEPPRLFGQDFLHNNGLSLWALHAWIWRHNPLGTFANYNPRVALCPGHVPPED
jgi:hypothetical protein